MEEDDERRRRPRPVRPVDIELVAAILAVKQIADDRGVPPAGEESGQPKRQIHRS